ncbi:hypothetical protein, partial [Klebsiella variicola]|uniref:hypothetical protein n=1 Tax=Klebsiella variicola TaxID=244366 RepID=UPI00272EFEF5
DKKIDKITQLQSEKGNRNKQIRSYHDCSRDSHLRALSGVDRELVYMEWPKTLLLNLEHLLYLRT